MTNGTQWGTFSLGEDERSQGRQFKNFLSVWAISAPRGTHSMAEFRNTKECGWHMELFSRARPPGGKMSWKDPILGTHWQEPGTRPPGLTQETRNCMATHSLPMKDGAPSCNVTSEPFSGAYKHTWTQEWAGTLQGDRDVITGNKGRRGALSGHSHAHWA